MTDKLQTYGPGAGIALGAGVGATAAVVSGVASELGVVTGFGVGGGLVVGAFAGRFADSSLARGDWALRVVAATLLVSLFVGGLLGALLSWTLAEPATGGVVTGSAAGGAFGLLLAGVLVAAGRE